MHAVHVMYCVMYCIGASLNVETPEWYFSYQPILDVHVLYILNVCLVCIHVGHPAGRGRES